VKNEDGGRSLIHRFRGEVKVKDLSLVDSSFVISSVVIGRRTRLRLRQRKKTEE